MTIGKTPAAGQSSKELTYSYSDVTYAQRDKIYYRIKQVDVDGTFTYTDIKGIELKKNSQVKLDGYPNPVKDLYHLTITGAKDDKVSIDVYDILGRSVSRKTLSIVKGANYHDLNMGTYTPGTYIVRVSSAEINESMTVVKVD
ncbi:MAG: T9SS type A sorting domain-containing protein [Saprospiraceae bacterium]|nr:T9SS type A sorting domain-containing protein [Saprospiraceae bacterium]